MDFSLIDQFVIAALLIAAVAADQAYPKPAYPKAAYPAAYPKSYDYVSSFITVLLSICKSMNEFFIHYFLV